MFGTTDILIMAAMVLYFIVIICVGIAYAKRASASSDEYFLGGRSVGPWLTALSAEASDMSGWLLMGLPGLAYFCGVSDAAWTAIGLALGTYLNWRFVASRLRRYSAKAGNAITVPEFFSNRFHDGRHILSTVAALITLIFFCIYVGSCFVTCGKLFSTLFGLDYATMMILGAVIVFAYTFLGGYLSVVTTDFIQAVLMFFALALIFIGTVAMAGGVDNTVAYLSQFEGFLDFFAVSNPVLTLDGTQEVVDGLPLFGLHSSYGVLSIASCLAWGLGYFGMPHVLVRFMGIRDAQEVKQSRRIATVWVIVSLTCAICIGLVGRAAIPLEFATQSAAENVFIVLTKMLLPSFACGIVVCGILAASMSSASSYLLITSSSVASDIFKGVLRRQATDEQVMFVARLTLLVVFFFGIAISLDENSVIFNVVSYAWAGLGASFGPLMLMSLYWHRTNFAGALAGMLTGAISVIIWTNFINPLGGIFGIYSLLPCFLLSLAAIVVFSLATEEPSKEIYEEFDTYQLEK